MALPCRYRRGYGQPIETSQLEDNFRDSGKLPRQTISVCRTAPTFPLCASSSRCRLVSTRNEQSEGTTARNGDSRGEAGGRPEWAITGVRAAVWRYRTGQGMHWDGPEEGWRPEHPPRAPLEHRHGGRRGAKLEADRCCLLCPGRVGQSADYSLSAASLGVHLGVHSRGQILSV